MISLISLILKITPITKIRRIRVQTVIYSTVNTGRPQGGPYEGRHHPKMKWIGMASLIIGNSTEN